MRRAGGRHLRIRDRSTRPLCIDVLNAGRRSERRMRPRGGARLGYPDHGVPRPDFGASPICCLRDSRRPCTAAEWVMHSLPYLNTLMSLATRDVGTPLLNRTGTSALFSAPQKQTSRCTSRPGPQSVEGSGSPFSSSSRFGSPSQARPFLRSPRGQILPYTSPTPDRGQGPIPSQPTVRIEGRYDRLRGNGKPGGDWRDRPQASREAPGAGVALCGSGNAGIISRFDRELVGRGTREGCRAYYPGNGNRAAVRDGSESEPGLGNPRVPRDPNASAGTFFPSEALDLRSFGARPPRFSPRG
jgi:hypothetical protein